jgi:hypothetical protein
MSGRRRETRSGMTSSRISEATNYSRLCSPKAPKTWMPRRC